MAGKVVILPTHVQELQNLGTVSWNRQAPYKALAKVNPDVVIADLLLAISGEINIVRRLKRRLARGYYHQLERRMLEEQNPMAGTVLEDKRLDFRDKGFAVKLGWFLFKFRSFILIPIYLFIISFSLWESKNGRVAWLIGPALICSGELLRLWAMQHIGRSARTREDKARKLVTTGPYVYTRNPLYVGNHIIMLGFCVLSGLIWFAPLALGLCFFCYHFIVMYEEELLNQRFGEEFLRYKSETWRWIPIPHLSQIFQQAWIEALWRERSTIRGLLIGMGFYVVKEFVFRFLDGV